MDWASQIIDSDVFAERERNYKLELGERFRQHVQGGLSHNQIVEWLRDQSNNVASWRDVAAVADADPSAVEQATRDLVSEGDIHSRVAQFASTLGELTDLGPGPTTTVASAFLMGSNPTEFPPYKTRAMRTAMRLAGEEPSAGAPADRYVEFLGFCDSLIEDLSGAVGRPVDRLDVQGACWVIGSDGSASDVFGDRSDEFDRWRGRSSSSDETTSVGHPEPAPIWWVNQGDTYSQQRDGGYLWAPQRTSDGKQLAHHQAVRSVEPGDRIVHYSQGRIRAIGTATLGGYEANRPVDLSGGDWTVPGLRADVSYVELDEALPLSTIPADVRAVEGGPFTTDGAVKQGYLFGIPAAIQEQLYAALVQNSADDDHAAVGTAGRMWVVYIGKASEANLELSLSQNIWGWKENQDEYSQMQPGDLFLYAVGYTGGSVRKKKEAFSQHGVRRAILAEVASAVYRDDDLLWPDETGTGELIYPYRIRLRERDDEVALNLGELDEQFGGAVSDAIQMSANKQGRAELVQTQLARPEPDIEPKSLRELTTAFVVAANEAGLTFGAEHETLIRSFITALTVKPFVILTGLSGSGKTLLAKSFGEWIGATKIVAVRPDWTSPDALFGFENALSEPVDGQHSWNVPETLEFILSARDNTNVPHLLLLDEMNLAHVERYFADALSGMESNAPIVPNLQLGSDGHHRLAGSGNGSKVELPNNLFVIGTVNIDETTYMFSPKVLDRANTFEFRVTSADLNNTSRPSPIVPADRSFGAGFLQARHEAEAADTDETFADWMRQIHELLSESGREFGHRTFQESLRFAATFVLAGESEPLIALDRQVAQKVLPRLHGSRRELSKLLDRLAAFCYHGPGSDLPSEFAAADDRADVAELPVSYNKLHRMAKKLRDQHFVSFAE